MKVVRHIDTLDESLFGGHVELIFDHCFVPVQICGALGISGDILLSRFLREVRPFRIYDGPSETHRWSIARRVLRRHDAGTAR
jgi:alkylation response protein AidB-like acyl-CoA dehydrogenase